MQHRLLFFIFIFQFHFICLQSSKGESILSFILYMKSCAHLDLNWNFAMSPNEEICMKIESLSGK